MKKIVIVFVCALPSFAYSQLGISFHQSNLPFLGINYEFKGRIRPELRISVDNYFEDLSLEGIATYDFVKTNDYQFYGGLGVRANSNNGGLVIPFGLNVYPLPQKQFGFHFELAPIVEEDLILRGSWGIRYRFNHQSQ